MTQRGRPRISEQRLREVIHYDPSDGLFRWLKTLSSAGPAGKIAGTIHENYGYVFIAIDKVKYRAHRLAFFYMMGTWPSAEIDHVNLDPADNRWRNLREATRSQNCANKRRESKNSSGLKGVNWHAHRSKWRATIHVNGKHYHLGYFPSAESAHAAYVAAATKHFEQFARVA